MSGATLLASLVAALANVIGALVVAVRRNWSVRALELMIALSAGFMLSVAIADIIPEAISLGGKLAGAVVLTGFVLVHVTQHVFVRHFHFGEETHVVARNVAASALVGLLLHTLIDGVAIASAYRVSTSLGWLVFWAIALHKLPEGLAISSLVLAAGGTRSVAIGAAALLGCATVAGVIASSTFMLLEQHGLALAGGVTVYVGASNLIPEFQGKPGWRHSAMFVVGCALYVMARVVFWPA